MPPERESDHIRAGAPEPVVVEVPGLGPCGLTVCYDLRFPELFRALSSRGARVMFVPASFALMTGKAHWETLLRARAIENLAWIVAPGQLGKKPGGRVRFGNTMIVDPWGTVVARAAEREGEVVLADVDLAYQDEVRRAIPCLQHRRM
jgi:deaminated glutathione amidase